mmetsp:Transcript_37661/g.86169  ORF Transcript_37661/g.86169 Transcript_37661/m.86169 type:complete len:292 (+) Transcript_37661:169-1044(+)
MASISHSSSMNTRKLLKLMTAFSCQRTHWDPNSAEMVDCIMLTPRPHARGLSLVAAGPITSRQRQPRWSDRRYARYASDRNPTRSSPPRQKSAVGLRMASGTSLGCGRASRRARASYVSSASGARSTGGVVRSMGLAKSAASDATVGALEGLGGEERVEASVEARELCELPPPEGEHGRADATLPDMLRTVKQLRINAGVRGVHRLPETPHGPPSSRPRRRAGLDDLPLPRTDADGGQAPAAFPLQRRGHAYAEHQGGVEAAQVSSSERRPLSRLPGPPARSPPARHGATS